MRYHRLYVGLVALALFSQAAQARMPRTANEFMKRAGERYSQGDYLGAAADYSQVIDLLTRLDSRRTSPLPNQFNALETSPRSAARTDGIRVVERSAAPAYANRSLARYRLNDLGGALADSEMAIGLDAHNPAGYLARGAALQAIGDLDGAIADYGRAIVLRPEVAEPFSLRGIVRGDKHDYCGALDDFDRAIALNTNLVEVYYNRAVARVMLGDSRGAVGDFDKYIAGNPRVAYGYNGRGLAHTVLREFNAGLQDFNRALEIDSRFAEAYLNRGLLWFLLGREARAREDFDRARSLDPQVGTNLGQHLAELRSLSGAAGVADNGAKPGSPADGSLH